MTRRLSKKGKILVALIGIIGLILISLIIFMIIYFCNIGSVSKNKDTKEIEILQGDTYYSISTKLKEQNLIKSEFFYKLYIKLNRPSSLQSGVHKLNESMSVKEIVNEFSNTGYKKGEMLTFKEGLNMRQVIKVITDNTQNTEEDILNVLQDTNYLDSLIEKYWFITDEIKNEKIYYSLEGYLFPDTYEFSKDATVKEIFNTMIAETGRKIEPYKNDILNSKYSFHELLTLSSIIELEGKTISDRNKVAGVFYNRLNSNWTLGSDVTTYYGAKINMSDRDLYVSELNDNNAYNTRSSYMAGKLPVGPICNPSISSIEASLYPVKTNYYYFVADKNGKTYFSKTNAEHNTIINKLKGEGLWYNY